MRTIDDWKGVAEENLCSHCAYRSICRDSAARGEAAWPVLTATSDDDTASRPPVSSAGA
jgi:hypothetical protein